jgi:hypothetical protein
VRSSMRTPNSGLFRRCARLGTTLGRTRKTLASLVEALLGCGTLSREEVGNLMWCTKARIVSPSSSNPTPRAQRSLPCLIDTTFAVSRSSSRWSAHTCIILMRSCQYSAAWVYRRHPHPNVKAPAGGAGAFRRFNCSYHVNPRHTDCDSATCSADGADTTSI